MCILGKGVSKNIQNIKKGQFCEEKWHKKKVQIQKSHPTKKRVRRKGSIPRTKNDLHNIKVKRFNSYSQNGLLTYPGHPTRFNPVRKQQHN